MRTHLTQAQVLMIIVINFPQPRLIVDCGALLHTTLEYGFLNNNNRNRLSFTAPLLSCTSLTHRAVYKYKHVAIHSIGISIHLTGLATYTATHTRNTPFARGSLWWRLDRDAWSILETRCVWHDEAMLLCDSTHKLYSRYLSAASPRVEV